MGDCSHSDPKSQPYLLCNNLEKLNGNKKSVLYQKTKKNVFIYKESILQLLVEFESNYNNRFIEVLNCVQFTAIGSLFWS